MTTENLGIVFAPNLLRAPNATEISVMDLQVIKVDDEATCTTAY